MFQKKRQLKKEKSKSRLKVLILALLFIFVLTLVSEYIYLNFSFGKSFLSPIAKVTNSQTLNVEKQLEKENINFSSTSINVDKSISVNLTNGGVVILSSKKDIRSQLSSLQLILSRLTIEGKKLKSLDLRFDSPVISF